MRREPGRGGACKLVRATLALTAAALSIAAVTAGSAQAVKAYGGEFYWGCTYSWGAACIEPHYHPKLETILTMDADEAHYLLPGVEAENRYPAARPDNVSRCVVGAAWNGTQYEPWTGGYDLVVSGGGSVGGYGMIGTCAVYYNISLYQIADWGGET